jgi:hypothetical protein
VTAYINGNFPVQASKFQGNSQSIQTAANNSSGSGNATLDISSTPPNADIEIDGNFIGNTPSSLGLTSGEHMVKITKAGYKPWQRKITTTSGTAKLTPELEIASPVTVSPTNAEPVTTPTSPAPASPVRLASQPVTASQPSGAAVEVTVPIGGNTGFGVASVVSNPEGADIFVDSVGHGKAPSTVKLVAGSHTVQIVLAGYKDWTSNIVVNPDSVVSVQANLTK